MDAESLLVIKLMTINGIRYSFNVPASLSIGELKTKAAARWGICRCMRIIFNRRVLSNEETLDNLVGTKASDSVFQLVLLVCDGRCGLPPAGGKLD